MLFVGCDPSNLARLCTSWGPLATIDNRFHLDNEERGRVIGACTLKRPLGAIWDTEFANSSL